METAGRGGSHSYLSWNATCKRVLHNCLTKLNVINNVYACTRYISDTAHYNYM